MTKKIAMMHRPETATNTHKVESDPELANKI